MHKPNFRQAETRALSFWRAVDAELARRDAPRADFREISTLLDCGFSVERAVDLLAPVVRLPQSAH